MNEYLSTPAELRAFIGKRKSSRSYLGKPVDDATLYRINEFIKNLKPLYPGIKVHAEVVNRKNVKCILPWATEQSIAIFSEKKEGYLENVGFLFQQLDLFFQANGLGACWLGMGRLDSALLDNPVVTKDLDFVILLSFGYTKGNHLRKSETEFKRKSMFEIADKPDERLEPARLAPSSVNSQPWFFVHQGERLQLYCARGGLLGKALKDVNRIDIGICLAHMYLAYPDAFRFFHEEEVAPRKGYAYIGTLEI